LWKCRRDISHPAGEISGGDQGRKSELEIIRRNIFPPPPPQNPPGTLSDIGRDLGFTPIHRT